MSSLPPVPEPAIFVRAKAAEQLEHLILQSKQHVLLLAEPGMGKTTLLRVLTGEDEEHDALRGRLRIEADALVVGERRVSDDEIAGIEVLD